MKIASVKFRFVIPGLSFAAFFTFCLMLPAISHAAGEITKGPSPDVCTHVLKYANSGRLKEILITSEPGNSTLIKVPEYMGAQPFKKIIDINNDGIPERVFESGGEITAYPMESDEPINIQLPGDGEDNRFRESGGVVFFKYNGLVYVLGKTNMSLQYLAYINPQNELKVVCEFGQRGKARERLKISNNDEVCKAALRDRMEYSKFNKLHSVAYNLVRSRGFSETHPGDRAALIDINNDGELEYVISMAKASGAGRGCDETFLAVLTPDRSDINGDFTKRLPGGGCGRSEIKPFSLGGKVFLEEKSERPPSEQRRIFILEGQKLQTVCEFEFLPENYVLSRSHVNARAAGMDNLWEYAMSQPGTAAVQQLLKEGRDVNEDIHAADDKRFELQPAERVDERPKRPIHLALEQGRDDILEVLLKAGADPNMRWDEHFTVLADAVWRQSSRSVELLLAYGARDEEGPLSAMSEAIYRGSIDKLEMLLKAHIPIKDGAAIEAVTSQGEDAPAKLKMLLAHGLNIHRPYKKSVIAGGIRQESLGVLSVGPDIKIKEVSRTLLQWAKLEGSPDLVRILVNAGAGATKEDRVEELRKADDGLNRTYNELLKSLGETGKEIARREQRKWIRDRDSRCGMHYSGLSKEEWRHEAAETKSRAACILDATKRRSVQLSGKMFPRVMSPTDKVKGRTQAEWTKAYWAWIKSFPKGSEPFKDESGASCARNQSGAVWFLAGGGFGKTVARRCRVSSGRHILLPVLVSLAESERSEKEICERMRLQLDGLANEAQDLYVEIDGKAVPNIDLWRQSTGCFIIRDGKKNLQAASNGYWLMLQPLAPGKHTICFGGRYAPDGISKKVEYKIDVK